MDQALILKSRSFPTAMLLPNSAPSTFEGLAAGIRRFTDAMDKPAVLYIKSDNYLPAEIVGQLHAEGRLVSIKYAVVRDDPAADPYLRSLIARIGTEIIVSGIGERPAIVHFRGLRPQGDDLRLHLCRPARIHFAAVAAAGSKVHRSGRSARPVSCARGTGGTASARFVFSMTLSAWPGLVGHGSDAAAAHGTVPVRKGTGRARR